MNEHISRILRHPATIPTVVGVVSFAAGVGAGILFERRPKPKETHENPNQLKLNFGESDLKMIIDANDYYREPPVVEDPVINTEIALRANPSLKDILVPDRVISEIEALTRIAGEPSDGEISFIESYTEDIYEPEHYNVFAASNENWDYELELTQRTEDAPYVIHHDEYHANERDFTQMAMVYYAGDDILVDDEDTPIFNYPNVTGELKFGHGSGDPDMVFIRNPKNKAEYEISRDDNLFSSAVLGLEIEDNVRVKDLRHSDRRRFKDED